MRREHGARTFPPESFAVEPAEPETTAAEACVVCGGASADLICQACRALLRSAAVVTPMGQGAAVMDSWWQEIDEEILTILSSTGPMDPADLAMKLGMSTDAVCSCLSLLSTSGRIRIRSVEATAPRVSKYAA
jgi:hypothetical protein